MLRKKQEILPLPTQRVPSGWQWQSFHSVHNVSSVIVFAEQKSPTFSEKKIGQKEKIARTFFQIHPHSTKGC